MPINIRIQHRKSIVQIFMKRGDTHVDESAEKGLDETLSHKLGMSFPSRDNQVAVYNLRQPGRKPVRRNGIEVECSNPPQVQTDEDFWDKLRAVCYGRRAAKRDRRNPANMAFARNQTYAVCGSIGFAIICAILYGLLRSDPVDETNTGTPTPVPVEEPAPTPVARIVERMPSQEAAARLVPLHDSEDARHANGGVTTGGVRYGGPDPP